MNILSNFVNSIGAMDGNQWGFVVFTNVVTGGVTYYATRRAYEVEETKAEKTARKEKEKKRKVREDAAKDARELANIETHKKMKNMSLEEREAFHKQLKETLKKAKAA